MCNNTEHHNTATCIVLWKTQCLAVSSHFRFWSQRVLTVSHYSLVCLVAASDELLLISQYARTRRTRLLLAHDESQNVEINNHIFLPVTIWSLFGTWCERTILRFPRRKQEPKGGQVLSKFRERDGGGGCQAAHRLPPPSMPTNI
jgi:hypothetical protein